MPAIHTIHWARVADRAQHRRPGTLYALWPEPVDYDACFAAAGFAGFADSDDAWDESWTALLARVTATLSRYGAPAPRDAEALARASTDDQWPPATAAFGLEPRATITAAHGHPILWIWLAPADEAAWKEHLDAAAAGLPACETALAWDRLLPEGGFR